MAVSVRKLSNLHKNVSVEEVGAASSIVTVRLVVLSGVPERAEILKCTR